MSGMYTHIDHSVPVDQPHHPWLWISSDSAAESRTATFRSAHCFWFCHKARLELFRFGLQEFRGTLPARFHLPDPVDGHHALRKLRLVHDSCLAGAFDDRPGLVCPIEIGCSADVLSRVLWVHPTEVHRHITEVVDGSEASLWGWQELYD